MKRYQIKKARIFSCLFFYLILSFNSAFSQSSSSHTIYSQALRGDLNTIENQFISISLPTTEEWYGYTFSQAVKALLYSSEETQKKFFKTAEKAISHIKSQKSNSWNNYYLAEI